MWLNVICIISLSSHYFKCQVGQMKKSNLKVKDKKYSDKKSWNKSDVSWRDLDEYIIMQ